MLYKKIEINTDCLSRDIENLTKELDSVSLTLEALFENMNELEAMWDGPAKTEYANQLKTDYDFMKEVCKNIAELIDCLSFADKEYISLENQVKNMISTLDI